LSRIGHRSGYSIQRTPSSDGEISARRVIASAFDGKCFRRHVVAQEVASTGAPSFTFVGEI
jgi:hypothetical protein